MRQLQTSDTPLDEALHLFERGQALATLCGQTLDQAELKVRTLVEQTGGYITEAFEPTESD